MLWRLACMSGSFYLLSSFFLPHISTIETHPWTFHHVTNISSFALRFHNCHRHTLLSVRNQRRCDSFSSKLSSNHRRASMHDFNTFNKKKKKTFSWQPQYITATYKLHPSFFLKCMKLWSWAKNTLFGVGIGTKCHAWCGWQSRLNVWY